jgi:N-dimethylarginine dimethylaminohydrolase
MKISTHNEWAPLKEVVVGMAAGANKPDGCHFEKPGAYPGHVTAQADMDLDRFARTLEQEGVKVHRPTYNNFAQTAGMYNYCPRDRLLVVGNTVVDCNMQYPCREQEGRYYDFVLKSAKNVLTVPRNSRVFFDAANVLRLNKTLLYLVSPSGNRQGAKWLQKHFKEYTIEITETYSGIHIDSTFAPVADGLVVVNKDRVTKRTLPQCFKDWEVIWLGAEDLPNKSFAGQAFASNYILLNFFMIRPNLAVIDDAPKLKQALSANGVDSYTIPFTHSRTLGGGHHCCTLDLHRR